jgi:hypothetical protein
MTSTSRKRIRYYLDFMDTQRCSINDRQPGIEPYSRRRINTLLESVLYNLPSDLDFWDREYVTQQELQNDENLNLIYYVFNLVWARATDLEKIRIVTIKTNYDFTEHVRINHYYINFPAISRIIREHSWQVCQLQSPCTPPFSIITGADTNDCVNRWGSFGGPKYSISVNNQTLDPNCQYVLFLYNFEETQVIDQIIGITVLAQIIRHYIYGDFSVVDPFSS